jgi:IQ calmodulin-binding motif
MDSYDPSSKAGASRFMLTTFHSPRDPGGLLPVGIESMMGEDPAGTVVSEEKDENLIQMSQRLSVPATPTRVPPASPQVLALLAGFPPPPPPDTPPPRRRRSRSTSRASVSMSKASELPSEVSFSLDAGKDGDSASLVPDPLSPPSPDGQIDLNPVVVQQSQTAQAIFNGDHLASKFLQQGLGRSMDPPAEGDRVIRSVLPQNQATPRLIVTVSQEKMMSPQRSPFSIVTEPRSNHQLLTNPYQDNLLAPERVLVGGDGSLKQDVVDEVETLKAKSGGAQRGNERPSHRRNQSDEAAIPGKLLGQHRRSNTIDSGIDLATNRSSTHSSSKATRSKAPLTSQRRPATPDPANNSSSGGTVATGVTSGKSISSDSRSGRPATHSNLQASKPSRKGFFKLLFGGKKKRSAKSEYNEVRPESEESKLAERITEVANGGNSGPVAQQVLGVEETSGLQKEEMQLLPAYSTDPYEDDHDFGDGRGSVVFAHDEVSTLTAPTMTSYHHRRDPSEDVERTSEPLGHYWNHIVGSSGNRDDSGFPSIDPFTEPFFQEPKGTSPVPKATASVELRVDVSQIADPIGESPLHSHQAGTKQNAMHDPSPQGSRLAPAFKETPSHDPVGESPLHKQERGPTALLDGTPYAPDPPLHLSTMENEASSTYSKDETGSAPSAKETISDLSSVVLPAGHPPRPPSPSPAVAARVSPRQQSSPRRVPIRSHPFQSESPKSSAPAVSKKPSVSTCSAVVVADTSAEKEEAREDSPALSVTVPKGRNRHTIRISPNMGTVVGPSRYDSGGPIDSDAALFSLSFASNDSEVGSPSSSTMRSDFSPSNQSLISQPTDEYDTFGSSLQKSSSNVSSSSKTSLLSRAEARKSRSRRSKHRLEEPGESPACLVTNTKDHASKPPARIHSEASSNEVQDGEVESLQNATSPSPMKSPSKSANAPTDVIQTRRSFSPKTLLRKKAQLSKSSEILQKPKKEPSDPKQRLHGAQPLDTQQGLRESKQVKQLSVSSAARMNAKAVAYLHTISGEPSPRRAWRRPQESDEEVSSSSGVTKKWDAASRPLERVLVSEPSPTESQVGAPSPRLFSPYNEKFKGRGLARKQSVPFSATTDNSLQSRASKLERVPDWSTRQLKPRNVSIGSAAVRTGLRMLRQNRDNSIASGRSTRVVPIRQVQTPKVVSYFDSFDDQEPLDPIQRAGRRLLSRAAIPVQSAARRFLAKRRAVDRMWALLEIQSYIRRWRAEVSFLASRSSAGLIQRIFRGSHTRREQRARQNAATQIQKVVRGYIYAIRVYEDVYRVILVQALARRGRCRRKYELLRLQGTSIQAVYRGRLARQSRKKCLYGVTKIQAHWRSSLIRTCYQFVVVDIIIVQSMLRRWLACKHFKICLAVKRDAAATKIQAHYRSHRARVTFRKLKCSIRLQNLWRRFSIVKRYQQNKSARKIQARWRGYSSRASFDAFKAAKSIQCTWRCFRARSHYERFKAARKIQAKWRAYHYFSSFKQYRAATRIQACWRGFQGYTDYVFVLVDVLVIQRSVRRWISLRKAYVMRQERAACAIATNWRRHRAQKTLLLDLMHIILVQVRWQS